MTWILALMALAATHADSAKVAAGVAAVRADSSARAPIAARADTSRTAAAAADSAMLGPGIPADTSARVPGASFKLGWSGERTSALGAFPVLSTTADSILRQGDCRWFGTGATARLTLRRGLLTRVVLSMDKPAPHVASYAADEMRRSGYRQTATSASGKSQSSDWLGRCRATLSVSDERMTGDFGMIIPLQEGEAESAPASTDTLDFAQVMGVLDTLPPPRFASRPPNPERPASAVQSGVFGRVLVAVLVDPTGAVVSAQISHGVAELNNTALEWARRVRYEPYVFHGRPCWFRAQMAVLFGSAGGGPPGGAR